MDSLWVLEDWTGKHYMYHTVSPIHSSSCTWSLSSFTWLLTPLPPY